MLAKVCSYSISGLEAYPITIEVHVSRGLPCVHIVGLPDSAVRESKERVRCAIKNSGYDFPMGRITVNLSPADIKKEGPAFDLAIAIGILVASEQIDMTFLKDYVFLGELSLDGRIQPVKGTLSVGLSLGTEKFKGLILPKSNAAEAAVTKMVSVYPVKNLNEVVYFLQNPSIIEPFKVEIGSLWNKVNFYDIDFSEVKGQEHVKRGLEIAAAGGHNVLMLGPPGSGKTMLARRMLTILPDMTLDESLETTKIHSVVGLVKANKGIVHQRPFRSPHHTSSDVALVGGGSMPRPGEVTLAHNGILFLDELPEFNRNVLESLRQPLEDHQVTISRANQTVRFPSRFMLLATMNPCPCGWYTDPAKECHCTPNQIQRYMSKISGPLLDRIDIHLEVPSLKSVELMAVGFKGEPSREIKKRAVAVRAIQRKRFEEQVDFLAPPEKIVTNAHLNQKSLQKYCALTDEGRELLKQAIDELTLSARAHDKILKVARTIADLEGQTNIQPDHIAEAIQYRSLDRSWGR